MGGAVDTTALINYEQNSVVAEFCRRAQAVTWNRALVKTESGKLGLVGKNVQFDDLVCILYGSSVPIILRKSKRKENATFNAELEWELKFLTDNLRTYVKRWMKRVSEHRQRARQAKILRMEDPEVQRVAKTSKRQRKGSDRNGRTIAKAG
jgi:hypothetical protein